MKHLLIVFHSLTGGTEAMAAAVARGAAHEDVSAVRTTVRRCREAGVEDLLGADALILGTPENFGYLSGAMKDFFDRTFYPAQGKVEGLPYSAFIKGGNDGTGALRAMRRIVQGFPLREVREPLICAGPLDECVLAQCEELGMSMAAGLELGMY